MDSRQQYSYQHHHQERRQKSIPGLEKPKQVESVVTGIRNRTEFEEEYRSTTIRVSKRPRTHITSRGNKATPHTLISSSSSSSSLPSSHNTSTQSLPRPTTATQSPRKRLPPKPQPKPSVKPTASRSSANSTAQNSRRGGNKTAASKQASRSKKGVKFVWTERRRNFLVESVKETEFFIGLPKDHDGIAKEILEDVKQYDAAFNKIDYKTVKRQLYSLQHQVCDIYEDQTPMNELKMELQSLYEHFKTNNISLDKRLYVSGSDGM